MDNGALVFIIAFEAVIIVWLLSKLKHYQKFEHLLSSGSVGASDAGAASQTSTLKAEEDLPPASSPSSAQLATAATAAGDDLLDIPGVEPEVNIEEAKRVQLVMARCRYAEFYLEQLDDDYERGQFRHIIESCMTTASGIEDPFFRASALHPLILLLDRAGWEDQRDKLMSDVPDDIIRQRIESELEKQQA